MLEQQWLNNHFLIAMPNLMDANFYHAVTFICEHNASGAMGLVINQPIGLKLEDLASQLGFNKHDLKALQQPIFRGGPVDAERGFVLHRPAGKWQSSLPVTDDITITTSQDILESVANNEGPDECLIALGYAGWGAGQLEREMAENAWLSGPATAEILFHSDVSRRWEDAAALLGVDIHQLTGEAGHA